ncbi:MAPEG family protein [Aliivibrio finisterrensis]|uniref:MAPEG family protein n=1 Tax=Aliivibrio finisterrensis TaxID=511998 RepID=UPI0010221F07|nr:MAPEG family protein [Aliivibrio finisterrensis]RYU64235.1 MAPEG family protein [Aliivibrio finisterrensis]RYU67638.1 MAPEG family protein [Aliivibrio finisterrensis]RYU70662.1 MAPEG family protein [Aliivibrio finisterrensis]
MEFIEPYKLTILVIGLSGFVIWLQLVIVDVIGIKEKHVPGFDIKQDHNSLLFRSNRALANSNESVGILILFTLFAIFSSGDASWVNGFSIAYLIGRVGHMLCYYFNLRVLRSIAFGVSFVSLLGIFIIGLIAWF